MNKKVIYIILLILFIISLILISIYINRENENILLDSENYNNNSNNVNEEGNKLEIKHINEENFKNEVLSSSETVLVDFYAEWCNPCKMLSKVIEEFRAENDNIKIVKVNIDENEKLATDYNIMSIPTLVVIKNGEEINRSVGLINKSQVEQLVK